MSPAGGALATWPCALRLARWATAPDREMRVYATKSGLDAPVYRASVPVRRHTRPTAWLPRTKPKPKPVKLFRKYTLVTHKHAANRAGGRLHTRTRARTGRRVPGAVRNHPLTNDG